MLSARAGRRWRQTEKNIRQRKLKTVDKVKPRKTSEQYELKQLKQIETMSGLALDWALNLLKWTAGRKGWHDR